MDAKGFSAYNEASKKSLSAGLLLVDAAAEPLKVLKVLMEGLPPRVKEGLWITRFTGIPVARAHTPFDLIYLDSEDRVLQAVEISQQSVFEPFKGIPASALVLRPGAIRASKTFTGDLLVFTSLKEDRPVAHAPSPSPRPPVANLPARVVSASTARSFNVPAEHMGTQAREIHSGPLLRSAVAVPMPAAVAEEAAPVLEPAVPPEPPAPAPKIAPAAIVDDVPLGAAQVVPTAEAPAEVQAQQILEAEPALEPSALSEAPSSAPEFAPAAIVEDVPVVAAQVVPPVEVPAEVPIGQPAEAPVAAAEPATAPEPIAEPTVVAPAEPVPDLVAISQDTPVTGDSPAPIPGTSTLEAELSATAPMQEAETDAPTQAQIAAVEAPAEAAIEPAAEKAAEDAPIPADAEAASPMLQLFATQAAAASTLEVPDDALAAPPVPSVPSTAFYMQIDHARQSQGEFLQLRDQLGAEAAALAKRWDVRLLYFLFPKLDPNYRAELQMPQIDFLKKTGNHEPGKLPFKIRMLSWLYPDLHLDTVKQRQKEMRRSPRLPIPNLVGYFYTGGMSKPHEIRNLSLTGFYMITDERYLPGTIVRITLQMKDSTVDDPLDSLTLHTRVVHWGPDGSGFEFVLPGFMDSEKQ